MATFEDQFPRAGQMPITGMPPVASPIAPTSAPAPSGLYGVPEGDPAMAEIQALLSQLQQAPVPQQQPMGRGRNVLGAIADAVATYGSMRGGGGPIQPFAAGMERRRQEQLQQAQAAEEYNRTLQNQATMALIGGKLRRSEKAEEYGYRKEIEGMKAKSAAEKAAQTAAEKRWNDLRGRAASLSDPNLVAEDDPMRELFQQSIMNQSEPGGFQVAQDENGFFILIPKPPRNKPFVPLAGGSPQPEAPRFGNPMLEPAPQPLQTPQPNVAPGTGQVAGLGQSGGGDVQYLTGEHGERVRGKASQTAQGNKVAIENAFIALDAMKNSYESSRGAGLLKQTAGALGQGASKTFPSLRGAVQGYVPEGDNATIHEMHRGTLSALMARPLSGSARAQWFANLLEEVIPHFTDTPKVAGTFYDGFLRFMENAKSLPWGTDPITAQQIYEDELLGVLSKYANSAGISIPEPPPVDESGSLFDEWQKSRSGGQ